MNQVTTSVTSAPSCSSPARAIGQSEMRLDALCELIDEELRIGYIGDSELATYTRRITGEFDQALTEVTHWLGDDQ